jgi:hypothetical protein
VTDVVPGEVKVGIISTPQSAPPGSRPQPPPVALPEKFRSPETTGVTVTITPENKDSLTIEMT